MNINIILMRWYISRLITFFIIFFSLFASSLFGYIWLRTTPFFFILLWLDPSGWHLISQTWREDYVLWTIWKWEVTYVKVSCMIGIWTCYTNLITSSMNKLKTHRIFKEKIVYACYWFYEYVTDCLLSLKEMRW